MLVILPACGLENGRKLIVRADQQVERGKVLAFCGPYLMNFLVLHVFAAVSVELNFIGKNVVWTVILDSLSIACLRVTLS